MCLESYLKRCTLPLHELDMDKGNAATHGVECTQNPRLGGHSLRSWCEGVEVVNWLHMDHSKAYRIPQTSQNTGESAMIFGAIPNFMEGSQIPTKLGIAMVFPLIMEGFFWGTSQVLGSRCINLYP